MLPTSRWRFPAASTAISLFSEAVSHRAELAAIELGEAREHAGVSLLLAGSAGVLVLLTGFAITFSVAAAVWSSPYREWWLAGLALLYLAGSLTTALVLVKRMREWRPLYETRNQLGKDYACLHSLVSSPTKKENSNSQ